jgi:hypothetical protein
MGATESAKHRYGAPAVRPLLFLFLRDRRSEASDGLAVAGKLVCPGWTKPVPDQQRQELADISWLADPQLSVRSADICTLAIAMIATAPLLGKPDLHHRRRI